MSSPTYFPEVHISETESDEEDVPVESLRFDPDDFSSPCRKICLSAVNLIRGEPSSYIVYVVNLWESLDSGPLVPILELDYADFSGAVMVVLGTKLYAVGGFDPSIVSKWEGGLSCWTNDVFVYDIKDALSSTETKILRKGSCDLKLKMKGRKNTPLACVIDDHRICVFAVEVYYLPGRITRSKFRARGRGGGPICTPPTFELLDTRDNSFTALPELNDSIPVRGHDALGITGFSSERSIMIVSTSTKRTFLMDFRQKKLLWRELSELRIPPLFWFHHFSYRALGVIINPWVLCTPNAVMHGGCGRAYWIDTIAMRNCDLLRATSGAICITDGLVCVFRCGNVRGCDECFLCVDALHPSQLVSGDKPVVDKSARFSFGSRVVCLDCCYPMKD